MEKRSFIIGSAVVLMLAGAIGAAEARSLHLHCKGAETFADGVERH